jgi:S-DNA-T family DNA segregation ATPase FtsK/SpoIIIE
MWTVRSEHDAKADPGPTDIQRMVRATGAACQHAQIPPPRRPWLPELRAVYNQTNYDQVPTDRRDDQLVYAILDNPQAQTQPTVAYHPDEGNLVVYGTGAPAVWPCSRTCRRWAASSRAPTPSGSPAW